MKGENGDFMENVFTSEKKLGFGLMRLPLLNPNDGSSIDIELTKKMVDTFLEKGFICRLYRLGEAVENIAHLGAGHGGIVFDKDEVVFGLGKRFGLNEQLLIQLFTGTQTYLFYLDIEVRLES